MSAPLERFQAQEWNGLELIQSPDHDRATELARSNAKLQAFAYTVAHDLKEPLRTISAFTQILLRKGRVDEADREIASVRHYSRIVSLSAKNRLFALGE